MRQLEGRPWRLTGGKRGGGAQTPSSMRPQCCCPISSPPARRCQRRRATAPSMQPTATSTRISSTRRVPLLRHTRHEAMSNSAHSSAPPHLSQEQTAAAALLAINAPPQLPLGSDGDAASAMRRGSQLRLPWELYSFAAGVRLKCLAAIAARRPSCPCCCLAAARSRRPHGSPLPLRMHHRS